MNKQMIVIVLIALAVGASLGYWQSPSSSEGKLEKAQPKPLYYRNPMDPSITSATPAQDSMGMDYIPVYAQSDEPERKVLFYRNPMNPDVTSSVPMKDSMGMDYVPVYEESGGGGDPGGVNISPEVVQNIGVRTAMVERKDLSRVIRAVARVDVNEERIARLHPKVEGWIEELFVESTGELITEDEILVGIYSPKLVASQQEYLLALTGRDSLNASSIEEVRQGAEQLVQSARERLQFFDVPEHQIRELEDTRSVKRSLHIHSPVAGTIINVGVRQGQYITPKTQLYQITDLSEVWVYVDVYDYELPWVKVGDRVDLTLVSIPGKVFTGVLSYIYPYAEKNTRTTKLRVVFQNPNFHLRPEMFAEALIHADRRPNVLVVPTEAIVRSGRRTQIFVAMGEGRFEPREVTVGISSGQETEVLTGLSVGEQVVTSAQFLIDSESKLNEATAKMLEAIKSGAKTGKSMEHSNHD